MWTGSLHEALFGSTPGFYATKTCPKARNSKINICLGATSKGLVSNMLLSSHCLGITDLGELLNHKVTTSTQLKNQKEPLEHSIEVSPSPIRLCYRRIVAP
ncbi:hypothetical protein XENTR_v10003704 [Xenopus tropicalis]|nr:hypothetical protein XENTR_v10003704 [Xenopus tropicalis]